MSICSRLIEEMGSKVEFIDPIFFNSITPEKKEKVRALPIGSIMVALHKKHYFLMIKNPDKLIVMDSFPEV